MRSFSQKPSPSGEGGICAANDGRGRSLRPQKPSPLGKVPAKQGEEVPKHCVTRLCRDKGPQDSGKRRFFSGKGCMRNRHASEFRLAMRFSLLLNIMWVGQANCAHRLSFFVSKDSAYMFFSGICSGCVVVILSAAVGKGWRSVKDIPHGRLNRYPSGLNVDHACKSLYRNHPRVAPDRGM